MVERDDIEVLKDEFKALKSLSNQLDSEVALFNYQFFGNQWNDQARRQSDLLSQESVRKDFIDSISTTFEQIEVVGYHH